MISDVQTFDVQVFSKLFQRLIAPKS